MKKRILSLTLALCLGLLPVTALAADGPTTLMVGGTSVIDSTDATNPTYWRNDGQGGITSEGADADNYNVYYDGSGTLTLNGAEIKKTHTYSFYPGSSYTYEYACGIFADGDLTIELAGETTIDISSADASAAGIFILESSLTIRGGGSLSVAATAAGTGDCNGIYAFSNGSSSDPLSITIRDRVQVTATAAGAGQCNGIYVYAGSTNQPLDARPASLNIEGPVRVIADARSTGPQNSRGIAVKAADTGSSLTIGNGAQVTADATGKGFNLGIQTAYVDSLSITDSTVDVRVSSTGNSVVGILSKMTTMSIKDSAVTIQADGATNATGIEIGNDSSDDEPSLSIQNSTVAACGAAGTGYGAGISVYRKTTTGANAVSITDSTVTARGASTSGRGCGICTDDGTQALALTTSGSLLWATGDGPAEGSGSICSSDGSTDTRTDSIVFENAAGTVSGWAVLPEDLTVARGETLTVPEGAELTVPADKTLTVAEGGTLVNKGTIVNNGQIIVWGTFINNGTLQGNPPIYKVTGVAVTPEDLALTVGGRATLTATVAPENATDQNVTWASSNSAVATVDAYGTVTAVGPGTATITVTTADGGKTAECAVTVEPAPVVNSAPTYSVTLPDKVEGGTVTANKRCAQEGETFRFTVTPDEGYQLDRLTVTDSKGSELALTDEGGGNYSFKMPARQVVVEAVFTVILPDYAACDGGMDCPLRAFTDVTVNAWYHDGVHFCLEEGVMAGYGNDLFGPDDALSRAQLCQIVYNLEGRPAVSGGSAFADVADGAWYADAVTWAAENGIVGGYGGGLFGPEDNITREQLAAILCRWARAKGNDVSVGEDTNILSYTDALEISEYAIPAMQWAVGAGIINGTGDGSTLAPQGQATRAQAAVMLMRFCENERRTMWYNMVIY